MQPVDFTTFTAACSELRGQWQPARLEQVYQWDRWTLSLSLRTLERRGWLTLSWHPQAARLCMGEAPPRSPDTFTFSQQLRHQLQGLALVNLAAIAPWERVVDLQFGRRPGDPPQWHLYAEIMSRYSNVILVNSDNLIVTAAHQVSSQQSSIRPIQTGQPYTPPPRLREPSPSLAEPLERWQERVALVPGPLQRNLLKNYRGLSSALVILMIQAAGLDPKQSTDTLTTPDWQLLFDYWRSWLTALETQQFHPGWLPKGYTVLGWGAIATAPDVQTLLHQYYTQQLNQQQFSQLHHQLQQRIGKLLKKMHQKAETFERRLQQSSQSEQYRQQADLLMAHLQHWQPGMTQLSLPDFETGRPVKIALDVEKNAVQNAQALYRQHQKLKRAAATVKPLLAEVEAEIEYLEQVATAVGQLDHDQDPADLLALAEIQEELIQQGYGSEPEHQRSAAARTEFYHYQTPGGLELLVGRNNRQNDQLTFHLASDYDLWFHTQEIPGSHVLLRLQAGQIPDPADLQFAADCAAYYSRARESHQVPVIYTDPKHVYKPRGAKPGMVVYKQEQVVWGRPQTLSSQAIPNQKKS